METLIKRFSEPSTYAGLAGLALILGINAEQFAAFTEAAAGLFAFIAIAIGES